LDDLIKESSALEVAVRLFMGTLHVIVAIVALQGLLGLAFWPHLPTMLLAINVHHQASGQRCRQGPTAAGGIGIERTRGAEQTPILKSRCFTRWPHLWAHRARQSPKGTIHGPGHARGPSVTPLLRSHVFALIHVHFGGSSLLWGPISSLGA